MFHAKYINDLGSFDSIDTPYVLCKIQINSWSIQYIL